VTIDRPTAIDPELESAGPGLRHYLDVLVRRRWIVLSVFLLTVGAAALATSLEESKYRAETKIVIGQGRGLFSPTLANAFEPFSATMSDLLRSNIVARRVIQNTNLDSSEESMLARMSVSTKPESSALRVSIVDRDPNQARLIAHNVGLVFSELVRERFGNPTATPAGQPEVPPLTATIWDPAHIDPARVSPRPLRDIGIAAVLGLILGLMAGFVRDHFDRALRSREAVEQSFAIPVIGQIPFERSRRRGQTRAGISNVFGQSAEAYRALRANLQYLAVERPLRTILVTSASPEQGKTTVTANLAVSIARSGASTLTIEADLRRPRLGEALGLQASTPGLTSVLVGNARLQDAVQRLPLFPTANGDDEGAAQLSFLPSGPLPPNPSELLSSVQMRTLLAEVSKQFDYVIIDSPPLLLVADALELTRVVDGTVLVVRRNRATKEDAREVRSLRDRLDIHLVGTVVTDAAPVGAYYGEYGRPRGQAPRQTRVARLLSKRA
jgi:capsular exopolysaccharide synthesis family protein